MHGSSELATLLGSMVGLWLVVGLFVFALSALFLPLMVLSMMRSMKHLTSELVRLNEILDSKLSSGPGPATYS